MRFGKKARGEAVTEWDVEVGSDEFQVSHDGLVGAGMMGLLITRLGIQGLFWNHIRMVSLRFVIG